ncbi:uncharacterized protein MELLADRAFT_74637, partial [Melampsora larici-populina 98AG31]
MIAMTHGMIGAMTFEATNVKLIHITFHDLQKMIDTKKSLVIDLNLSTAMMMIHADDKVQLNQSIRKLISLSMVEWKNKYVNHDFFWTQVVLL